MVTSGHGPLEESPCKVTVELFDSTVADVGLLDFGFYHSGVGKLPIDCVGAKCDPCHTTIVGA